MIEVFFDGACGPKNPGGTAAYGIIIKSNGKTVFTDADYCGCPPNTSNNLAEYHGLRRAFTWLLAQNQHKEKIIVFGDSNLVIQQIFGNWRIKNGIYKSVALDTKKLKDQFTNIQGKWIPRELNYEADLLSKSLK